MSDTTEFAYLMANKERAARVDPFVRTYAVEHEGWLHYGGLAWSPSQSHLDRFSGLEDTIIDIIADLLHLAKRNHLDVERITEMSAYHFAEELDNEELENEERKTMKDD